MLWKHATLSVTNRRQVRACMADRMAEAWVHVPVLEQRNV